MLFAVLRLENCCETLKPGIEPGFFAFMYLNNSPLLYSKVRAKAPVNTQFCSNPAFKGGVNGCRVTKGL